MAEKAALMAEGAGPGRDDLTIGLVGIGLIGGSMGIALRRAGFKGRILGVSRPGTLDEARRLGIIDEGFPYERLIDAAEHCDLIILCSPILRILEHLEELGAAGERLKPGAVVSDVGSTKGQILARAVHSLPGHVHFIGGHPLAGSEQSGVGASDPFLFQNALYVLTPAPDVPEVEIERLASLIETTGARVVRMTAEKHDRVAAHISHLPQLLAVHLVTLLDGLGDDREIGKHLAAGGFRNMTRIASSPFSMWRDIIRTNRREIVGALEAFVNNLKQGAFDLDEHRLESSFRIAAAARAEIPVDTKGFITRLTAILVEVEDRPGMITDLAIPLAEKGINIRDIEVLKVRENEGGTMRLAFASRELAIEAVKELESRGFKARLRE